MPSAIRERAISVAATRNPMPVRREEARTAKAIANATAAWALGNEGSGDGADRRCVIAGWAVNGRGRSHRWEITWFVSIAIAAAASPDTDATFHRRSP